MKDLHESLRVSQVAWRKANISTDEHGTQNKRRYSHILPKRLWEEGLWPGIRSGKANSLATYLGKDIQHHTGVHNLLSSWVACANLYFPFRQNEQDLGLLAAFLRISVNPCITTVTGIELEWADPDDFSPAWLLGEKDGRRGSGQTSPDVAFLVHAKVDGLVGNGVVLVESKLTEKSFYRCSARTKKSKDGRPPNPDPGRCNDVATLSRTPKKICHQVVWGRKYWDHLEPDAAAFCTLKRCPAATGGYQLLRQQALANGLRSPRYPFVASCVAHDERNEQLLRSLKGTGLLDLRSFGSLFRNAVPLTLFTHQAWWRHVRAQGGERWRSWAKWIQDRYVFK